jgi:hypothetical protein
MYPRISLNFGEQKIYYSINGLYWMEERIFLNERGEKKFSEMKDSNFLHEKKL